jgi:Cdc6-like AAA superfamily ATPase
MKLRVQRFVPEDIKENRIIFIIGKRGTGKTILLRDIMSKYPPVDICVGMTPTEETADVFREFLPESCIYHEFNLAKLEQMLAVQRELIRKKINRRFLLILDDCLYQKGCLKSSAMRDLVMNGRHLHIALAVCVQYLMDISPDIRANIDYTFALRENIIANRAKMWKFFFGMFSKYEDFAKAMDATTNNFCCMVMDNTNKSTAVEDTVFWYKAGLELNEFKMGRSCYWKMDKRCLMSREDREREEQANTKKDASRERITTVQTVGEDGTTARDNQHSLAL